MLKYHIDSGTVTPNEVREKIGLDEVTGGDQLIEPVQTNRWTVMSFASKLNGIADPHERRLARAMQPYSRRLTDALAGLPLRDGALFDLDAALLSGAVRCYCPRRVSRRDRRDYS